jgi:predicted lipoprotein with Yx(FWY)xxD motif
MNIHAIRFAPRAVATIIVTLALAACAGMMPAKTADGMLTDQANMTLYTFDKDVTASGKSVCNGPCATNWPPFAATSTSPSMGDWTIITRDDGTKQWAFKGKPLYTFAKDKAPGDKTGDGFLNGSWHIVRP